MNINYKQSQFELFPGTTGGASDAGKPRYLFANLTLSLENIVIVGIVTLMTMVFAFSLGVEKGKKITRFSSPVVAVQPTPLPVAATAPMVNKNVPGQTVKNPSVAPVAAAAKPVVKIPAVVAASSPIQNAAVPRPPVTIPAASNLPSTSSKSYTIQVASFKEEEYAKKEAAILKNKKLDAFVVTKGNFSIVCVGKFSKKDDANGTIAKLKRTYNDCLVRRF